MTERGEAHNSGANDEGVSCDDGLPDEWDCSCGSLDDSGGLDRCRSREELCDGDQRVLGDIVPYSKICNISSDEELSFQGVDLTGVSFDFLESKIGVSFDENCTLNGVRINGIRVQREREPDDYYYYSDTTVRLVFNAPMNNVSIVSIEVDGRIDFNGRIHRSNITRVISDFDVAFRSPFSESALGLIEPKTTYAEVLQNVVYFDGSISSSKIEYIKSVRIAFNDVIGESNLTTLVCETLQGYMKAEKARNSNIGSIEAFEVDLGIIRNCTVDHVVAYLSMYIERSEGSSFGTIEAKRAMDRNGLHLGNITNSFFGYVAGLGHPVEFSGPVRTSTFGKIEMYDDIKFGPQATLVDSTFVSVLADYSRVWFFNQMKRTRFGELEAGYLYFVANTSRNIDSTFGMIKVRHSLTLYDSVTSELVCSSLSVPVCNAYLDGQWQDRECPVCVA